MTKFLTYIDESGNTGADLANKEQPFFVISSVTIPDGHFEPKNTIQSLFNNHKQIDQKEFKTNKWINSSILLKPLGTIFDSVIQNAVDINVVVLEKRYMAAALIVDNLFDGAYNDTEDYSWILHRDLRITTTNDYYSKLSDEELDFAGETLIDPTFGTIEKLYDIVYSHTEHPYLLGILKGVKGHLNEIVDAIQGVLNDRPDLKAKIFKSPNLVCFSQLGQLIVEQAKKKNYQTTIIFDSEPRLNGVYKYTYEIFQRMRDISVPGIISLSSWFDLATDFIPADSKLEPGLQAADVIASSVSYYLNHIVMQGEAPREYDLKVKTFLRNAFHNHHCWSIMSNKFNNMCFFD